MITKYKVKRVSKVAAVLGVFLVLAAAILGYRNLILQLKTYIIESKVSIQEIRNFNLQIAIQFILVVTTIFILVFVFNRLWNGYFHFLNSLKWSFYWILIFYGSIGYFLFDRTLKNELLKALVMPIIPAIFITMYAVAAVYLAAPEGFFKQLLSKEGRKELVSRFKRYDEQLEPTEQNK